MLKLSHKSSLFLLRLLTCGALLFSVQTIAADAPESDALTRPVGHGLYELAYDSASHTLFAASAPSFKGEDSGIVYSPDPATLEIRQQNIMPHRAFSTALDAAHHKLYIGNTLDGSVTVMDTQTLYIGNFTHL